MWSDVVVYTIYTDLYTDVYTDYHCVSLFYSRYFTVFHQELAACKKTVEDLDREFSKREQETGTLKSEVDGLESDVASLRQQLEAAQTGTSQR